MPDATRLHLAHRRRLARLRAVTLAAVMAAEDPNAAVPVVLEAQRSAISATDAYMSMEAGLATGTETDPWGLDPEPLIGRAARRGDLLEDVYARNWAAAAGTFAQRMAREVNTDITLAERSATFVHTEADTRIVGYRRVLGGGANCGLCVVAASQKYHRSELRPVHHACKCSTQAIYGDAHNWRKPGKATLQALYERAGSTDSAALRRITNTDLPDVEIVDGVLGPTLV